jgi:hypothetical protein
MWIRLDTGGRYLPVKRMLTQHQVLFITIADSVLAMGDTLRNRQICTLVLLSYPCSIEESIALGDLLMEIRTSNPKRITKMS